MNELRLGVERVGIDVDSQLEKVVTGVVPLLKFVFFS